MLSGVSQCNNYVKPELSYFYFLCHKSYSSPKSFRKFSFIQICALHCCSGLSHVHSNLNVQKLTFEKSSDSILNSFLGLVVMGKDYTGHQSLEQLGTEAKVLDQYINKIPQLDMGFYQTHLLQMRCFRLLLNIAKFQLEKTS